MDLVGQIERLAELRKSGSINDIEYERFKAHLLEGHSPQGPSLLPQAPPAVDLRVAPPSIEWMTPCGSLVSVIGVLGFLASLWLHHASKEPARRLLAGLSNPLFVVGVPLGLYWLSKSGGLKRVWDTEWGRFGVALGIIFGLPALIGMIFTDW